MNLFLATVHLAPQSIDVTGGRIAATLTQLAGNLFIVVIAFGGVVALVKRRFVVVLELAALAVIVASFVYAPSLWENLGKALATLVQGGAGG